MSPSRRFPYLSLLLLVAGWICLPAHAEDEVDANTDTASQQGVSYRAKLLSQLIPDQISAGENFVAIVQYQNKSGSHWSTNGDYFLAPVSHESWLTRVDLPKGKTIAPGETVTFRIAMTAPLHPGSYQLQWQMQQGNNRFGEPTSPVMLKVFQPLLPWDNAEFVYQDVPRKMAANHDYTVVMQFKNTGKTSWTNSQYALAELDTKDNLTWAINQIELPPKSLVKPGEFQTFRFTVRAPATPGQYRFHWQLLHLPGNRFGASSEKVDIEVVP